MEYAEQDSVGNADELSFVLSEITMYQYPICKVFMVHSHSYLVRADREGFFRLEERRWHTDSEWPNVSHVCMRLNITLID